MLARVNKGTLGEEESPVPGTCCILSLMLSGIVESQGGGDNNVKEGHF